MKVTIDFDLSGEDSYYEKQSMKKALQAEDLHLALWDFTQEVIRSIVRNDDSPLVVEILQQYEKDLELIKEWSPEVSEWSEEDKKRILITTTTEFLRDKLYDILSDYNVEVME